MKKVLLAVVIAMTAMLPLAAAAFADPPDTNPGADCSHGNSGATCVPDPNENGQDCDEHGAPNPAGNDGNEDHCTTAPPTTTTAPPTTTTAPPVTTTEPPVTTTAPPVTTTAPPVTTTAPPVTTTAPTTTIQPPGTNPTTVQPPGSGPNGKLNKVEQPQAKKLAFTGMENVVPLGAIALTLLTSGSGLLWFARKKDED